MHDFLDIYLFHWLPSKAIWISGHSLSWDARCSGIYIGFGIAMMFQTGVERKANTLPPLLILLINTFLFFPLFLDVFTLNQGLRNPSNDIRYFTGLLFGNAFSVYLYPAFNAIIDSVKCSKTAINSLRRYLMLLTLIIGGFFLKSWNNISVYLILEVLAVFGCISLFVMVTLGFLKMVLNLIQRQGKIHWEWMNR